MFQNEKEEAEFKAKMSAISKERWQDPEFRKKNKGSTGKTWKMSDEAKLKMSLARKAYYANPENREKQSELLKTLFANDSGYQERMSESAKGKVLSEETKIKIGEKSKGRVFSEESLKKKSISMKKIMENPEVREKIGKKSKEMWTPEYREAHSGENHWNWQGGITEENHAIRTSLEYKEWRMAVFKRDNWTCQECGKKCSDIHADHIKPFSLYPELRFEVSNGRTLCENCHDLIGWSLFRENNPHKFYLKEVTV